MNSIVFTSPTARRARPAFTLVELLVVIVIIGILIALLIPAVNGAITTARNGVMAVEVGSLAQALEAYRIEHGSYPPDFAGPDNIDKQKLDAHLARKFRYRQKDQPWPNGDLIPLAMPNSMLPAGVVDTKTNAWNLDPSEALVFWLSGFSSDPKKPLTGAGDRSPLFDFDETRLVDADGDGFREYLPKYSEQPYVYLHKESYEGLATTNIPISTNAVVKPYASSSATNDRSTWFVEPEKYQIICAGQDSKFLDDDITPPTDVTALAQYPNGIGYSDAHEDNLTNFSEGKTLEDAIP